MLKLLLIAALAISCNSTRPTTTPAREKTILIESLHEAALQQAKLFLSPYFALIRSDISDTGQLQLFFSVDGPAQGVYAQIISGLVRIEGINVIIY